jgi:hypothetical protein
MSVAGSGKTRKVRESGFIGRVHCYRKWWKIPLKMVVQYVHPKRGIFHLPGRVEKFHPVLGVLSSTSKVDIIPPSSKIPRWEIPLSCRSG